MTPKVIIIDKNEERLEGMAYAFWGIAEIYKISASSFYQLNQKANFWTQSPPLDRTELMLIHGRDHKYKDVVKTNKRIWYGGFQGKDPDAEPGEDNIYRAINTIEEVLTAQEAKEALQNLHLRNSQKEPLFFKPPSYQPPLEPILGFLHFCSSCRNLNTTSIQNQIKGLNTKLHLYGYVLDLEALEGQVNDLRNSQSFSNEYITKLSQIREHLFSCINLQKILMDE